MGAKTHLIKTDTLAAPSSALAHAGVRFTLPPFNALSHRTEAVCNVGESCRGFGTVSVGTSR